MNKTASSKNPMARVMSLRDFRLLFAGATTSLLGDQFALIATPWLVLKLTGDPFVLGIVLALEGIPRAVFMLLGGAITDRLSPRLIMMIADIVRFVLTVLMAFVVFSGIVQIWMLYVFGLGFGLVAGFAIPAENTMVPMLVDEQDLQAGNSIMMGISQLAGFIGPTVAGILIGGYASSLFGVGLAFAVDALSFAVSAGCLWLIRMGSRRQVSDGAPAKESVWHSILTGIKYLWNDRPLRLMFLVISAANFLLIGPLLVGIPVLADQRLPEGAVAFGLLMSAYAGGNLVGYLLAGSLPRPSGGVHAHNLDRAAYSIRPGHWAPRLCPLHVGRLWDVALPRIGQRLHSHHPLHLDANADAQGYAWAHDEHPDVREYRPRACFSGHIWRNK